MSVLRGFIAVCWIAILCLAASVECEKAMSQSYTLQRRIGFSGSWDDISRFAIKRRTSDSSPQLMSAPSQDMELTSAVKGALANATFVHYRVLPDGAAEGDLAVSLAISPCSLVRGFDAVDSRVVVLKENIGIAVGPGTSIIGLQSSSTTNSFHAKMVNGDECDISILSLFPQVRLQPSIEIIQSARILVTPDYTQLDKLTQSNKEEKRVKNAENAEGKEGDEKEDNRTFLEKYWVYMVIPIVVSFIQSFLAR